MRLSEKRIQRLAKKISEQIVENKLVEGTISRSNISTSIAQTMIQYFLKEEEIEAEARENLLRRKSLPPPGTGEYEALFQQEKMALARKKGYVL